MLIGQGKVNVTQTNTAVRRTIMRNLRDRSISFGELNFHRSVDARLCSGFSSYSLFAASAMCIICYIAQEETINVARRDYVKIYIPSTQVGVERKMLCIQSQQKVRTKAALAMLTLQSQIHKNLGMHSKKVTGLDHAQMSQKEKLLGKSLILDWHQV